MTRILRRIGLIVVALAFTFSFSWAANDDRVYFRPAIAAVAAGDTLSAYVALDSGISLVHYYRVKVQFDSTVLHLDTIVPSRTWDSIALANAGQSFFYKDSLDPTAGAWYYDVFSAFYTQPPHIDGPNDVARIRFTALKTGVSPVTFHYYRLENNVGFGEPIPCTATDGIVYVCPLPEGFQPGNVNDEPPINVADLTYLIAFLFRGGPEPVPVLLNADVNCQRDVNVADLTYLIAYLFRGGPAPCDPCS